MSREKVSQQQYSRDVDSTPDDADDDTFTTSETTVEGAAFLVPDELQGPISDYRTGLVLPENEIVVATANELYVVFTDAEPQKGIATVDGTVRSLPIEYEDLTFTVIEATNTNIAQTGTERSVSDLVDNPSNYAFELVRLTDHHQSVAIRTRDDAGEFSFANTTGIISEANLSPGTLFNRASDKIRSALDDPTDAKLESRLNKPGESFDPFVYSGSFDTAFWQATPSIIDGVVLTPGTKAREFIDTFGEKNGEKVIFAAANKPLIWIVQRQYDATTVTDMSSLTDQPDGELVSIQANVYQQTVSVQEVLEESTACLDAVQVNGSCVPVINDVILHGGAAWTKTAPNSEDDLVPVFGLSALEQREVSKTRTGEYEIVGEVVTTDRIDERLPDGIAVLAYDMHRLGEINYDELSSEIKSRIEDLAGSFATELKSQAEVSGDSFDPVIIDATGDTIAVGNNATIAMAGQEIEKLSLRKLWTDWQIADETLDGGSRNNKIEQAGVYEITWSANQADVSPSLTITPPEDTYVGGEYLVDLVAHGGGDETTAILSITDSSNF